MLQLSEAINVSADVTNRLMKLFIAFKNSVEFFEDCQIQNKYYQNIPNQYNQITSNIQYFFQFQIFSASILHLATSDPKVKVQMALWSWFVVRGPQINYSKHLF